ncbi:Presenilin-domain-containing protein [Radiomyces spectabilis]|uniref:Presenilin-domain-containing protein n=1 Tax=Radiomyces spectabilis TaxID=64574 RepID=UPI00222085E1|nr:Presenilin-domain-containing protein [Radiomyces spectabilis]KAI8370710.1 Presenilin-domain-containing protein [Radiomyces spectabilis]
MSGSTLDVDQDNDEASQPSPTVTCTVCQSPATFMCSSCGLNGPRYCSLECQKTHWKQDHYKTCQASAQARRSRSQADALNERNGLRSSYRSSTHLPDDDPQAEHIQLRTMSSTARQQPAEDQEVDQDDAQTETGEEDFADDLKFYMHQIYLVIKPVVVCIILSIFWVKVSFSGQSDYSPTRPNYIALSGSTGSGDSQGNGGSSSPIVGSFTNAAIIIGQIIAITVIIVFLFRKGWIKVLIGFFMVIVLLLLGFMTYLLLLNLVQVFSIPLDYITMVFALWNFAVVGLVSIFWKGPLWLQQGYLTIMSSLMAFSLTGLEQWTTWILLGLLAIWDLIAVLCPFGPLRLLIESSRTQQREVPALLYSVNAVWFMMASADHFQISNSFNSERNAPETARPLHTHQYTTSLSLRSRASSSEYEASTSSTMPLQTSEGAGASETIRHRSSTGQLHGPPINMDGFMRLRGESSGTIASQNESATEVSTEVASETTTARRTNSQTPRERTDEEERDEEDAERSGLKLGLGDFVFYSVLIARAAMYDWITTVCCTIAVLMGLTATIFLLAIYKKALPALPISIAFGILFYFVAKTVLVPYIGALCVFGMVGI